MPTLIADPRSPAESKGTRQGRAEGSRYSGIASRIKAWFPASSPAIAGNYAAAASLILLGYAFYATVPYATEVTRVYYDGSSPRRAGRTSGSSPSRICCCSRSTTRHSPMTIRSSAGASGRGSSRCLIADRPPRRRSPFGPSR